MLKQYQKIDWSQYPENITSFGDTNDNVIDKSLDDLNSPTIDAEEFDDSIKK